MSFSTYHSRLALAERLLARDADSPEAAAMHIVTAERAENRNHAVSGHTNQHLAPAD